MELQKLRFFDCLQYIAITILSLVKWREFADVTKKLQNFENRRGAWHIQLQLAWERLFCNAIQVTKYKRSEEVIGKFKKYTELGATYNISINNICLTKKLAIWTKIVERMQLFRDVIVQIETNALEYLSK